MRESHANTTGITAPVGLDDVPYSYSWSADNTAIGNATDANLKLTSDQQGKTNRGHVRAHGQRGYEETLTSATREEVAGRSAEARLGLSGFDAGDGQDVLASALIRAGNRGRKNNENQCRAW